MIRTVAALIAIVTFLCATSFTQTQTWNVELGGHADRSAELTYGPEAIVIAETIGSTVLIRFVDPATGRVVAAKSWEGRPEQTPGERKPKIAALDSGNWLVLIENRLTLLDKFAKEVRHVEFDQGKAAADYNPKITLHQALILSSNGREAAVLAYEENAWPGRLYWIDTASLETIEEKINAPWPFPGKVSMTDSGEIISSSEDGGFRLKRPQTPIRSLCSSCKEIQRSAEIRPFDHGLLRTYVKGKKAVGVFSSEGRLLWKTGCPNGGRQVRIESARNAPFVALVCSSGFGSAWTVAYGKVGSKDLHTIEIAAAVRSRRISSDVTQDTEITPRIALSPAGDRLLVLRWPGPTLTSYQISSSH